MAVVGWFATLGVIAALVVEGLAVTGWFGLSCVWWLVTLVLGRMPEPLCEATAATLRPQVRFSARASTHPARPQGLFGDDGLAPVRTPPDRRPVPCRWAGREPRGWRPGRPRGMIAR